jgi:hypothetical protein
MDSLYFTELVERSENNTEQETGEHRTYMEQGICCFSKILVCTKCIRHGGTYVKAQAHRREMNIRDFVLEVTVDSVIISVCE